MILVILIYKNIRRKPVYAHISGRATAAVCVGFPSRMLCQVAGMAEDTLKGGPQARK